jgi:CBS domain-containing protein
MSGNLRLARHTPVSVCQGLLAIEPLLADTDEELLVAMRRSAAQPTTRLLGVLDHTGRIVGVVPISRLAEAVIARVVPESLMAIADVDDAARFGHAVGAHVVGDVMLPPATVSPGATIADAFRLMHQRRLPGLYVAESDGRPTGYLDLLELAIRYVDALEEVDPEPDAADSAPPGKRR